MTLLHEAVEAKKFDTRMLERNIARGVTKSEQVDQMAKSLPDDAESADWVSLDSLASDQTGGSGASDEASSQLD